MTSRRERICVIAVVGGSGAGKSWLVARLRKFFGPRACHVQMDDFYLDRSGLVPGRHKYLNFDQPASIDWPQLERFLRACRAGRDVVMPAYDYVTHRATTRPNWRRRPIVILEGLWLLRRRRLAPLLDLKLYLDVPARVRNARRIERDVAERGFTAARVSEVLRTQVLPLHARFVAPQQRRAHLVLTQPYGEAEIAALAQALWRATGPGGEMPPAFRARLTRTLEG
jgi:uridine kinase